MWFSKKENLEIRSFIYRIIKHLFNYPNSWAVLKEGEDKFLGIECEISTWKVKILPSGKVVLTNLDGYRNEFLDIFLKINRSEQGLMGVALDDYLNDMACYVMDKSEVKADG